MKLTILGAGTCASQLPGIPNRTPPAFLVEWGNERMLFDCSEGVRFRLEAAGYDYASITHIAISHAHPDHYALAHYIQSVFCKGLWGDPASRENELNVYCPPTIAREFPALWKMYTPDLQGKYLDWPKLVFRPFTTDETRYAIGEGTLSARSVYHGFGRVDARAYRLETPKGVFVYSGDTGECEGIRNIAKNADMLVIECSARIGDEETPVAYGHLNPRLVGDIAKQGNVKKVIIFHNTGLEPDSALIAEVRNAGFEGEVIIGADGGVLEI